MGGAGGRCSEAWTVEAWVRYTGPGGKDRVHTYAFICGTDEEGFSLPRGMRGGWSFILRNGITPGHPRRRTHSGSAIHGLGGQRSEPRHQQ